MPKGQHKKKMNKTQGNMAPTVHIYPATANPEYANENEAQEEDLKSCLIKMIEVFKKYR
jgi:DNA-binding XRE family transcriptional regulator